MRAWVYLVEGDAGEGGDLVHVGAEEEEGGQGRRSNGEPFCGGFRGVADGV